MDDFCTSVENKVRKVIDDPATSDEYRQRLIKALNGDDQPGPVRVVLVFLFAFGALSFASGVFGFLIELCRSLL